MIPSDNGNNRDDTPKKNVTYASYADLFFNLGEYLTSENTKQSNGPSWLFFACTPSLATYAALTKQEENSSLANTSSTKKNA